MQPLRFRTPLSFFTRVPVWGTGKTRHTAFTQNCQQCSIELIIFLSIAFKCRSLPKMFYHYQFLEKISTTIRVSYSFGSTRLSSSELYLKNFDTGSKQNKEEGSRTCAPEKFNLLQWLYLFFSILYLLIISYWHIYYCLHFCDKITCKSMEGIYSWYMQVYGCIFSKLDCSVIQARFIFLSNSP